ncbi:hypothetical protein SAMN02990966_00700 [Rhodospirillales bacterium URHD0017]|nr:hypothetical protein SAMN02990966_00700 [Rhodospirillales bacterium URHD0017]
MSSSPWLIVLAFCQVLTALVVGGVGLYFADQQRKNAAAKLRLDLFEHRYKVLDAVRRLLSAIVEKGNVSLEELGNFSLGTVNADFLFDDGIAKYLAELRNHAATLMTHTAMLNSPNQVERTEAAKRKGEEIGWFLAQIETLNSKFGAFLKLGEQ